MLRAFYDQETKKRAGRSSLHNEVLKRAGIILSITAWETYIEDTLTARFKYRIAQCKEPREMQSAFNLVAEEWLNSKPTPPQVAKWASSGWKQMVSNRFYADIEALNTPNSINIRRLTKRYLGFDLTTRWKWPGVSSQQACQKLDDLIKLRGRLAHRGRDVRAKRALVSRSELVKALSLVTRLAFLTEMKIQA